MPRPSEARLRAKDRLEICGACPNLFHNFCRLCRCFMPGKVLLKHATCPANKWPAVPDAATPGLAPNVQPGE
jgi:hypothetical protein